MKYFIVCLLSFPNVFVMAQQAQGFFLNDHAVRNAVVPTFTEVEKPQTASTVTVTIDADEIITPVPKYVYGNNANVYMTQMTDQTLLNHIKELSPNVLRFPGGNLSSVYFWNAEKNIPPIDAPAKLLDSNGTPQDPGYWYGKNDEGWTMSVDSYYAMLQATNSMGIITVNYGYARYSTASDPVASAAHLAAEWVRYDNGRTKYWEIGNESNGSWQAGYRINTADNKDGQPEIVTGPLYGQHFKIFADSMRKAAAEVNATIYIGAQLLQEEPASWWNATDKNWNTGVLQASGNIPDYYIIHSYYTPYQVNSTVTEILNSATVVTKSMRAVVDKYIAEAGVTPKPLALTEWNIFAEGSKQQASSINGIHAVLVLGELIQNKYGLACRWDLANGWGNGNDHGTFSQGDATNDPLWNPRAVFYYMYYFQKFFGDVMVKSTVSGSADVVSYASRFNNEEASVVLVNKGATSKTVSVTLNDYGFGDRYYYYTLTPGTDNGSFPLKVLVNNRSGSFAAGGPPNYKTIAAQSTLVGSGVKVSLPARSVTYILVDHGDNVITGVEDDEVLQVEVFPNPAKDKIRILFPESGFSECTLMDVNGKNVFFSSIPMGHENFTIDVSLKSGIYFLKVQGLRKVLTKKILITD
jgi:hypothetical protein